MVVTDLDGTLLSSNRTFPSDNIEALRHLETKGIIRVIATGRSPYSADLVLPHDFPIDYLIFSSGAGIVKWSDRSILHTCELPHGTVNNIINVLISNGVDFMVQDRIPHNHHFYYHSTGKHNPDFERRVSVYREFCQPLMEGAEYPDQASQIVAVLPNDVEWFHALSAKISGAKIIRSTSPLDGNSIWLELFAEGVSKASGISWLCQQYGSIAPCNVMTIGNDYNDFDMLHFTPHSYVVANAPDDLKQQFKTIPSNDEAGFAWIVDDERLNG